MKVIRKTTFLDILNTNKNHKKNKTSTHNFPEQKLKHRLQKFKNDHKLKKSINNSLTKNKTKNLDLIYIPHIYKIISNFCIKNNFLRSLHSLILSGNFSIDYNEDLIDFLINNSLIKLLIDSIVYIPDIKATDIFKIIKFVLSLRKFNIKKISNKTSKIDDLLDIILLNEYHNNLLIKSLFKLKSDEVCSFLTYLNEFIENDIKGVKNELITKNQEISNFRKNPLKIVINWMNLLVDSVVPKLSNKDDNILNILNRININILEYVKNCQVFMDLQNVVDYYFEILGNRKKVFDSVRREDDYMIENICI